MGRRWRFRAWVCVLALVGANGAEAALYENEKLELFADFRARLEIDWNSMNPEGVERDDRVRLRTRVRFGVRYDPDDHFSIAARLRSGSDDSQQSPHITLIDFNGIDTGDSDFNLDRWYARFAGGGFWSWLGRNDFPFWKQNELFWDDDVTVLGAALGGTWSRDKRSLAMTGGCFRLPVGMQAFSGNLVAAQVAHGTQGERLSTTVAAGAYRIDPSEDDPDAAKLLTGNGYRDYTIVELSGQLRRAVGGRPLAVGLDLLRNLEDYDSDDADPFTAANHDQTDGFVVSAVYGSLAEKNSWLVGYWYAWIEAFAVHASYAEDDWERWGTANQARSSNFKGHELRYARAVSAKANVVARLFLIESITTVEDGNRFRVDLDIRF